MPRQPSIPSYRLHKPSGRAIVVLSGRTVYLGKFGTKASQTAYNRAVAEWLAANREAPQAIRHRAGAAIVHAGLTVAELGARYLRFAQIHFRQGGKRTGELWPIKSALRVLRENYGRTLAAEFGPLKLQALQQSMIQTGWARTTINDQTRRVIRVFRWGVTQELVPPSVPAALREVPGLQRGRTAAKETARVEPVADAVFQATLPHLPQTVADLLQVVRFTGARPGEICSMTPGEVDRSAPVWLYRPSLHKNAYRGHARVIAIGPKAQAVLAPYLLRPADQPCFQPNESERRRRGLKAAARITPAGQGNSAGTNRKAKPKRQPGRSYDSNSLGVAIRRACLTAFGEEAKPWSANQLRHAAATEVRAKYGLEAAQCVLGHAEANVTQIYAERDLAKAAEVVRAIG